MNTSKPAEAPLPCRQHLRRLELQAYSSMVSVFRAQGDFNSEKKRILNELQYFLSIPLERHQAEIRRAVADEHLSKVANSITGEETRIEWMAEGRRLVPLIPRAIPQTKATKKATAAAADYLKKQKDCNVEIFSPSSSSPPPSLEESNQKAQDKETTTVIVNKRRKDKVTDRQNNEVIDSIQNLSNNQSIKKQKMSQQPEIYCLSSPPSSLPSYNDQTRESGKVISNVSVSNPTNSVAKVAFTPTYVASVAKNFSSIVPSVLSTEAGAAVTAYITSAPSSLCTRQTIISNDNLITAPVSTTIGNVSTNAVFNSKDNAKSQVAVQKAAPQVKFTPTQITIPCTGATKMLSPGKAGNTLTPQVVVFSSQSQPKTITIPISQSVKTLQLPVSVASGTPTIFYQSAASSSNVVGSPTIGTVKSIPTGFTIKTFKPGQQPLPGNYIIMPKNATVVRPTSFRTITISKENTSQAQEIPPATESSSSSKD